MDLPTEIWEQIFSYTTIFCMAPLRLTCKRFRDIIDSKEFRNRATQDKESIHRVERMFLHTLHGPSCVMHDTKITFGTNFLGYAHGPMLTIDGYNGIVEKGQCHKGHKVGKWYTYETFNHDSYYRHCNRNAIGQLHGLCKYSICRRTNLEYYVTYENDILEGPMRVIAFRDNEWKTVLTGGYRKGRRHGVWEGHETITFIKTFRDGILHGPFMYKESGGRITRGTIIDNHIHYEGDENKYRTDSVRYPFAIEVEIFGIEDVFSDVQ